MRQLLDADDLRAARLIAATPAMLAAPTTALQWADLMGGWDAPCWAAAGDAVAAATTR